MSLLREDVYRDSNGWWFWRCPWCARFDGAYRTVREATVGLYNHKLRRHTR